MKKTVIAAIAALMSTTTVGDWEAYPEEGHRSGAVAVGDIDHKNMVFQIYFPQGSCDRPVLEVIHAMDAARMFMDPEIYPRANDGKWPGKGDWSKGAFNLSIERYFAIWTDFPSDNVFDGDRRVGVDGPKIETEMDGPTHISYAPLRKQDLRYLSEAKKAALEIESGPDSFVHFLGVRGSAKALKKAEAICRSK